MRNIDIESLLAKVRVLPVEQLAIVDRLVQQLSKAVVFIGDTLLDPFSEQFSVVMGTMLRAHHAMSTQPFTKDKFEYAMVEALVACGIDARHAPRGLAGHDIQVGKERWSLKSQADRSIRKDRLHISKFMELGKGEWIDEASLYKLRDRFLDHMGDYDRIFSLRHFEETASSDSSLHVYELVEIPKSLLQKANEGEFEMRHASKQNPKPGYCRVKDSDGDLQFELYFDGGSERKLQIKNLMKSNCVVVGSWSFERE